MYEISKCYPFLTMIHLELQPEIESQLAAEAHACGLALEHYIEKIVEARSTDQPVEQQNTRTISVAIDRILEMREDSNLGGLSIKELINEGRKH